MNLSRRPANTRCAKITSVWGTLGSDGAQHLQRERHLGGRIVLGGIELGTRGLKRN